MQLVLRDTKNTIHVSEHVFGYSFNESLIHQIVVAYTANTHKGTRSQKTRAEVKGSGRKPWRQKGSGRARAGSLQSPIWRSGGVTFATKPQYHTKKINKKMYRGAMKSILSELIRQDRLIVVDNLYVEKPKTKLLIQRLKDLTAENVLIITNHIDTNLFLAARNLSRVEVRNVKNIDPVSLITFGKVIMTGDSIQNVEKILS